MQATQYPLLLFRLEYGQGYAQGYGQEEIEP